MPKAGRNKTIDTTLEQGAKYLARCLTAQDVRAGVSALDKTVNGDMLEVCALLPRECADLIIADPPYNLRKSYDGTVFSKKRADEYERYTREWLTAVKPLLKPAGSIYVCCDWESSLIIGRVMEEMFTLRNRITWQREKGRGAKRNWKNGMEDIWFATMLELYDYLMALRAIHISADGSILQNPTTLPLWVEVNGEMLKLDAGSTIHLS